LNRRADGLAACADGLQVAIVRDRKVHRTAITVGRDFGTKIEALCGVTASDQL